MTTQPLRLVVRVTPRGGRDAIEGWEQDQGGKAVLKVRVAAAPDNGEANRSVEKLLAKALRVPKSAVRIVAGAGARVKQIEVDGLQSADAILGEMGRRGKGEG